MLNTGNVFTLLTSSVLRTLGLIKLMNFYMFILCLQALSLFLSSSLLYPYFSAFSSTHPRLESLFTGHNWDGCRLKSKQTNLKPLVMWTPTSRYCRYVCASNPMKDQQKPDPSSSRSCFCHIVIFNIVVSHSYLLYPITSRHWGVPILLVGSICPGICPVAGSDQIFSRLRQK